ncbi:MAG: hypothetical protein MUP27_09110 [Desulfobacterales bacterium]|nr:hypothetical protein [Desulfobacterales bacterium]
MMDKDQETGLQRFNEILQKTDPFEMTFGEESYPWLTEVCHLYAQEGGITVEQATGIVAVLSPMINWRENLFAARRLIQSGGKDCRGPGFRRNYEKGLKILRENDLSVISGPKILPFYRVLLDHTCQEVVVDTHMLSAFNGIRSYTVDSRGWKGPQIKMVTDLVKIISGEKGWLLSRTQATIWITWKRITKGHGDQLSLWGGNGDDEKMPNMWKGILCQSEK